MNFQKYLEISIHILRNYLYFKSYIYHDNKLLISAITINILINSQHNYLLMNIIHKKIIIEVILL